MNKSESIKELAIALCKAQGEMQKAHKKSDNPFFNSTYANLSEVLTCVKESFTGNGLCFTQMPSFDSGIVYVETMIMHESGEWMTSTAGSPISKNNPQGVGDAVTYLRRYSLAAISGLAQHDDDGNSNSGTKEGNKKQVDDNKDWYNETMLNDHHKFIMKKKGEGLTGAQIVKEMRQTYKVASKFEKIIEELT